MLLWKTWDIGTELIILVHIFTLFGIEILAFSWLD